MSDDSIDVVHAVRQGFKKGSEDAKEFTSTIRFVIAFMKALTELIAYPWTVILHYEFGERYLNGWLIFFNFLVLGFASSLFDSTAGALVAYLFLGCFIFHRIRVFIRNKKGIRWHSRSNGLPLLELATKNNIPRFITEIIIEPFVMFMAGCALAVLSVNTQNVSSMWGQQTRTTIDLYSLFLIFSAVCLCLHQCGNYRRYRELLLDQIDSNIVSEHFSKALDGASTARETDGFVVQGADGWTEGERQTIRQSVMGNR